MAETRSGLDSIPLGEEDLCDILKELTGVAARWRNIGILLGIPPSDLDAVRSDRPIDCMLEMLLAWLRKAYNVNRFGEPTWLKLVEVVANKAGGENTSLAEDIARRHKCTLSKKLLVKQYGDAIMKLCPQEDPVKDKQELLITRGRDQVLEPKEVNTKVDQIGVQQFEVKQPKLQMLKARSMESVELMKNEEGAIDSTATTTVRELGTPQLKESKQEHERIEHLLTRDLAQVQMDYEKLLERKSETLRKTQANLDGKEAELLVLKQERVMLTEELHRVQEERGKLNLKMLQKQRVQKKGRSEEENFDQSKDSILLMLQDRITRLHANFVKVYQDCSMETMEPSRTRLVKEMDAYLSKLERLQLTVGSLACRCPLCSISFYTGTALDVSRFRHHMHNHLSKSVRTDMAVQREAERVCPVCNTKFPAHIQWQDFEHHVSSHFMD